jgi:hypothetical protein
MGQEIPIRRHCASPFSRLSQFAAPVMPSPGVSNYRFLRILFYALRRGGQTRKY